MSDAHAAPAPDAAAANPEPAEEEDDDFAHDGVRMTRDVIVKSLSRADRQREDFDAHLRRLTHLRLDGKNIGRVDALGDGPGRQGAVPVRQRHLAARGARPARAVADASLPAKQQPPARRRAREAREASEALPRREQDHVRGRPRRMRRARGAAPERAAVGSGGGARVRRADDGEPRAVSARARRVEDSAVRDPRGAHYLSYNRWSPRDPVGVVHAVPRGRTLSPGVRHSPAHPLGFNPDAPATPFNSTPDAFRRRLSTPPRSRSARFASLRVLDLSHCQIEATRDLESVLLSAKKLTSLDARGNPGLSKGPKHRRDAKLTLLGAVVAFAQRTRDHSDGARVSRADGRRFACRSARPRRSARSSSAST